MRQGEQGDQRPFRGTHVLMARPVNAPQGLSRPHPPIRIARGGEPRTLPLVTQYGDACNMPPTPDCRASSTF
jgi:alkanesulfonate monooxygenase SsuD/methylene tetrahydromethanopterin reductase-like flavin-dependent oxidoreductase (luciferase family)